MIVNHDCAKHMSYVSIDEETMAIQTAGNIRIKNVNGIMKISCSTCNRVLYSGKKSQVIENPKPKGKLLLG